MLRKDAIYYIGSQDFLVFKYPLLFDDNIINMARKPENVWKELREVAPKKRRMKYKRRLQRE